MAIKERQLISREDFDAAVLRLRLNVSEVAKATGVSRSYLSEFRNGDRKLRPEHQAKLRDYFEEKGIEFEDDAADEEEADQAAPTHPSLHERVQVAPICYMPIRSDLDDKRVRKVFNEIEQNDDRIEELCNEPAARTWAFVGKGDFDDETQDKIRELFARLAANYVLVRYLTGVDNLVSAPPATDTLHEVLLDSIEDSVAAAEVELENKTSDGEEEGNEDEEVAA